jgi:hypothetical protein
VSPQAEQGPACQLPSVPISSPAAAGQLPSRIRTSPSIRLHTLLTLLLVQSLVLVVLIRRDPFITARLQSYIAGNQAAPAQTPYDSGNDPKLGSDIPRAGPFDQLRGLSEPGIAGYLLVAVGDCAGCMSADLPSWERQTRESGVKMILVTSATRQNAIKFCRELKLAAPFVTDSTGTISRFLNATWTGRTYLFSSSWELRWLSRDSGRLRDLSQHGEYLTAVKRLLK